ncbi:MAG: methanol oxidation system protein MoxJ [Methylocella sp.]
MSRIAYAKTPAPTSGNWRFALLAGVAAIFGLTAESRDVAAAESTAAAAAVASAASESDVLRICATADGLPFSARDGSGFENKIGSVVAEAMGRRPVFIWSDKPGIYLVRDYLDKNACDVIVGADTGDERVLTTKPYYRAGYVFVSRADSHLDVTSWDDPKIHKLGHIVIPFGSPAETMLKTIGRYEVEISYLYSLVGFKSPRNQYVQIPSSRMAQEVAGGNADLAVAFAPEIARYVKSSSIPLQMTVVADDSARADGMKVPEHFNQSMAVRKGDDALLADLNSALDKAQPQIEAILKEEGVPLLRADE